MASEYEAYIDGRLDVVQQAAAQGDSDTVMRQIAHLRAEGGSEAADVLTQKLIERGLGGFAQPPVTPPPTIPAGYPPVTQPTYSPTGPTSPRSSRMLLLTAAGAALVSATVAVVVTMQVSRPTATTTTVTTPQPSTTVPLPPAPPAVTASTTSTAPPILAGDPSAAPTTKSYKILHPLTDFTLGHKGCSDSDEGTLDIDELAPNYRKATLENSDCGGGFGLSYGGKYGAKASLTQPTPDECESQAKRGSQQHFELDSVKPGQFALCVVSDERNVAWVSVVDVDSKGALALKIIVWSPVQN